MGHTKIKTFTGAIFLLIWLFCLLLVKPLKNTYLIDPLYLRETAKILLLYLSIPIFVVWLGLGISFGLPVSLATALFIMLNFESEITIFPILSFMVISFLGYRLNKTFQTEAKSLEVDIEKIDIESNLLSDKVKVETNDNSRIRSSLKKISHLKNVIEKYSGILYTEDILGSIADNCFELFNEADRVLLYLVDTEKQELNLVRSKRKNATSQVKAKKGDVFDRWVLKHRMPLIAEDIHKDFRFSPKKEIDQDTGSLISAPLTTEHKILGILRIDSTFAHKFNQSDIRFLDIIGDLSAVCLQNAFLYKKVQDLAIHDSLTSLYVHKYFKERLTNEAKRSLRSDSDLSLLMLDLDKFKDYNDKYGHNAGDLVLKHVASIVASFLGPGDIAARYGGEEFSVLLANADKASAGKIAENIKKKISQTPLVLRREKTKITVSIGVATLPTEAKTPEDLLSRADTRLYKAKENGRNRVCVK